MRGEDLDWLVDLMAIDTVNPLEGGDVRGTAVAQQAFVDGAARRGWRRCRLDRPPLADVLRPDVPRPVRDLVTEEFLDAQPSAVVAMGASQPPERRIVWNFHMDTVGPHVPPRLDGDVLVGRGAVDDKGPGVAALAGVTAAFEGAPWLADVLEVRVASVPGEEGGAMGTYGTRWLVESGCVGRLMLFAEPTGGRVFDACSAAMTPVVSVHGEDSTDDHPTAGHNATLALAFVATRLATELGPLAEACGAKVCVAGLDTGSSHNRVHGRGELKLNIAYHDTSCAEQLARAVEDVVAGAGDDFAARHGTNPLTRRIAADWSSVVRIDWLKRGLPALQNRDPVLESLLGTAGFPRHDAVNDGSAFTCDAIWAPAPNRYVAACGPGDLAANGAHTPAEHVALDDLRRYADGCRDLVLAVGAHLATDTGGTS